jgi:protein-disulfide isomerase
MAQLSLPVGERDHIAGASDSPIVLVEYGDYECPHCGHAYPIVKKIQKTLGSKLAFVFRNFPLADAHPHAEMAAEAAEAAGKLGSFWAMHDIIFEHQTHLDNAHLVQYAAQIGVDEQKFLDLLERRTEAGRVRQDFISGARSGVNGTPTFFINGVRYDDSWEYERLLQALESATA